MTHEHQSPDITATFLRRCLHTLEHALAELKDSDPDDIAYDIYRAACVKEFELPSRRSDRGEGRWVTDYT